MAHLAPAGMPGASWRPAQPDGRLLGSGCRSAGAGPGPRTPGSRLATGRSLCQASYATLAAQLSQRRLGSGQRHLAGFGGVSMQLDTPRRGFSFQADAPLDMRFDPPTRFGPAELVNGLSESELARLIYRLRGGGAGVADRQSDRPGSTVQPPSSWLDWSPSVAGTGQGAALSRNRAGHRVHPADAHVSSAANRR